MPDHLALIRRLLVVSSLVLVVLAGACRIPDGEVVSEGDYLVFDPMGRGQTGMIAEPIERVFRDEDSWTSFRDSLTTFVPLPDVDFEQTMVVVLALPQETGGFGVETASVELRAGEVVVEYVVTEPASDCIPVVGASLPFEVIRVRRSDLPVRFDQAVEPYRCTWKQ